MELEDLQVARALPGPTVTFEVQNAAEAVSQGIEFDATYFVDENWTIGGNMAYTDATYDDFPGAQATCPEVGGFIENGLCNFRGIPLIFAPEFKGAVFVEYESEPIIGDWTMNVRADANYSGKYYTELAYFETLSQDEYVLLNASVQFASPDGRYAISLIGKNLTDQHVLAWGLEAGPSQFVTPNPPREIGIRASYRYYGWQKSKLVRRSSWPPFFQAIAYGRKLTASIPNRVFAGTARHTWMKRFGKLTVGRK